MLDKISVKIEVSNYPKSLTGEHYVPQLDFFVPTIGTFKSI